MCHSCAPIPNTKNNSWYSDLWPAYFLERDVQIGKNLFRNLSQSDLSNFTGCPDFPCWTCPEFVIFGTSPKRLCTQVMNIADFKANFCDNSIK